MQRLKSRAVVIAVMVMFALASSGCGTFMHPERKTATPSDKLDGKIVVLDCLWLLVGVIPGVIALAVDFYNDTIYFSEGELSAQAGDTLLLNIWGQAPADSGVTLRLLGRDGRDLGVPAEARSVSGSQLSVPLTLISPRGVELAGARVVLAVDGRPQVGWSLQTRAN